mmetsp:Transcript_18040/g.63792  ORF Transcript_18040/g.63792 Transcript_18040/m.63792 type:complete len:237 (-) Transcript_18040:629-1339(-)
MNGNAISAPVASPHVHNTKTAPAASIGRPSNRTSEPTPQNAAVRLEAATPNTDPTTPRGEWNGGSAVCAVGTAPLSALRQLLTRFMVARNAIGYVIAATGFSSAATNVLLSTTTAYKNDPGAAQNPAENPKAVATASKAPGVGQKGETPCASAAANAPPSRLSAYSANDMSTTPTKCARQDSPVRSTPPSTAPKTASSTIDAVRPIFNSVLRLRAGCTAGVRPPSLGDGVRPRLCS